MLPRKFYFYITDPCIEEGIAVSAPTIWNGVVTSQRDCQTRCQSITNCYRFAYRSTDNYCWIYQVRTGTKTAQSATVNGPRFCPGDFPFFLCILISLYKL